MPCASVAWMSIAPLRAFTGTPSTSMLTSSWLMSRSSLGSRRAAARLDEAVGVLGVMFELVPVMADEALHRPRGSVAERADGVALDLVGDVDEHVDIGLPALPRQNPLERAFQPAGAFTARSALATGFHVIEPREPMQ